MYTVQEISKKLGITTQSVYSKLNNTMAKELQEFVKEVKRGNRTVKVVTEEGVRLIEESLESFLREEDTRDEQVDTKELLNLLQANMDLLQEQLATKDKQLDAKDLQIAELNERLKNQQQLNNNQMQIIQKEKEIKAIEEKSSWWDKITGKSK